MQDDREGQVDHRTHSDDPDAPPRSDELRAAKSLREALRETEDKHDSDPLHPLSPRSAEARWLAAHLRFPTEMESLGEVRARGLARSARELVAAKRSQAELRSSTMQKLSRALTGTGGLLLGAAVLLMVSWAILDQGSKLRSSPSMTMNQTTWLLRESLRRGESPTARLDLLLQERLRHRRILSLRSGVTLVNRHHRVVSPNAAKEGDKVQ